MTVLSKIKIKYRKLYTANPLLHIASTIDKLLQYVKLSLKKN